jgi:hypothetical protein
MKRVLIWTFQGHDFVVVEEVAKVDAILVHDVVGDANFIPNLDCGFYGLR